MINSILEGNKVHDDIFWNAPVCLQIPMASRLLHSQLGNVHLGQELPVNFTNDANDPATSNLQYYLRSMISTQSAHVKTAIIVTFRGNTFAFVKENHNNIILLDSHLHAPYGALVAS